MAEANIADKSISELPSVNEILDSDLFLLQSNGTASKLTGRQLLQYCISNTAQVYAGPDEPTDSKVWINTGASQASGSAAIAARVEGNKLILTDASGPDAVMRFNVDGAWKGIPSVGVPGAGVSSVSKTGSTGLVDHYKMELDDDAGTEYDFDVTNGRGISSLTGPVTQGMKDTYTITFNDGTSFDFVVTNGSGACSTVNNRPADSNGNVYVDADHIQCGSTTVKQAITNADLRNGGSVTGNLSISAMLSAGSFSVTDFTEQVTYDTQNVGKNSGTFFLAVGNLVFFSFVSESKTFLTPSGSSQKTIFGVPEKYAPKKTIYFPAVISSRNSNLAAGGVFIGTDRYAKYAFGPGTGEDAGYLFVSGIYEMAGGST